MTTEVIGSDIGFIFNSKKTKYKDLNEMLGLEGYASNITNKDINFFIDTSFIFDFFKVDYYANLTKKIIDEKQTFEMAGEFFNLIGHYRNYFAKLTAGNIRFFIINAPYHGDENKEADNLTKSKYTHPKALKFLDFIVEQRIKPVADMLNSVYVISTHKVHKTVIPYILFKNKDTKGMFGKSSMNIFMAKSLTFGQYSFLAPNSFFFNKNKFVNKNDIFDTITSKYKNVGKVDRYGILAYQVFTGEDSPFGVLDEKVKARKTISLLEENQKLSFDNYNDSEVIGDIYKRVFATGKVAIPANVESLQAVLDNIIERINYYDIINKYNTIEGAVEAKICNEIIEYEADKEALFNINNTYFNNIIMINNLL